MTMIPLHKYHNTDKKREIDWWFRQIEIFFKNPLTKGEESGKINELSKKGEQKKYRKRVDKRRPDVVEWKSAWKEKGGIGSWKLNNVEETLNELNPDLIPKFFWEEQQRQTIVSDWNEWSTQTKIKDLEPKGFRYHLIKSLILAQDERWRRA